MLDYRHKPDDFFRKRHTTEPFIYKGLVYSMLEF